MIENIVTFVVYVVVHVIVLTGLYLTALNVLTYHGCVQ
jgi:hypothetical protein